MGKQTEKSRYPSLYSHGKYITAAQYIIETVCQKKAAMEKRDLPPQFWHLDEWKKFFSSQLRKCHLLLKKYDERAIINGLKNKRAYNIRSLFAPWLIDIIEEEQRLLDLKAKVNAHPLDDTPKMDYSRDNKESKPRSYKNKNNALSKLMELDNGKK